MEYHLSGDGHTNNSIRQATLSASRNILAPGIIQLPRVRGILTVTYSMICVIGALGNAFVPFYLY